MDVGTAEPIEEKREEKKSTRFSRSKSAGSGGTPNNGGGGAGGDPPKPEKQKDKPELVTEADPVEKSKILMWFLLLVVLMTFGGLIAAYIVIATNKPVEWQPFRLPVQVWVSTFLILASSITYHIAKKLLVDEKNDASKRWFLVTTVLGAGFISSQILLWMQLVNRGFYMSGNPFAGFVYILTAVHAVHVLGGIAALGYIILRTWNKTQSAYLKRKRIGEARVIGWYWHTMDALWLVLLYLLGFWNGIP